MATGRHAARLPKCPTLPRSILADEMQSWRRFWSLTAADRVIVMEAGALMVFIRLFLKTAPFLLIRRALRAYARIARVRHPTVDDAHVARVAWGVPAAARRLPFRATCLIESLAAEAMLMRRGVPCVLRLGVRPPDQQGALDAHAWIECRGGVVAGVVDRLQDYAVLAGAPRS